MNWIDLLIVTCGVLAVSLVAWAFLRGGAHAEKARNRAVVVARLEALGKVKADKFGGLR